jgi:hypothetical protein
VEVRGRRTGAQQGDVPQRNDRVRSACLFFLSRVLPVVVFLAFESDVESCCVGDLCDVVVGLCEWPDACMQSVVDTIDPVPTKQNSSRHTRTRTHSVAISSGVAVRVNMVPIGT